MFSIRAVRISNHRHSWSLVPAYKKSLRAPISLQTLKRSFKSFRKLSSMCLSSHMYTKKYKQMCCRFRFGIETYLSSLWAGVKLCKWWQLCNVTKHNEYMHVHAVTNEHSILQIKGCVCVSAWVYPSTCTYQAYDQNLFLNFSLAISSSIFPHLVCDLLLPSISEQWFYKQHYRDHEQSLDHQEYLDSFLGKNKTDWYLYCVRVLH